jgi:hypothetical protein
MAGASELAGICEAEMGAFIKPLWAAHPCA